VAIITDGSPCILAFYKELERAMKSHKLHEQLKPNLHHVVYDSCELTSQRHQFYMLKLNEVSLVFMLVPMLQGSELFRDAEHFALLSPSQLWVIPHYAEDVSKHKPARTLTFTVKRQIKETKDKQYKEIGSMVTSMVKNYWESKDACKK